MNQSFGKEYKLCSKKIIGSIFENGHKIHAFPFTLSYQLTSLPFENVAFQVVISVPKRNFKRANKRNRIKRLMREALRKNKFIVENFLALEPNKNKQLALFLTYRHNEELDYEIIMKKMSKILQTLITTLNENEHK